MKYLGFYTSAVSNFTLICVQTKRKSKFKPFEVYYFDVDFDEPVFYCCRTELEAKLAFDLLLENLSVSRRNCRIYSFNV